MTGIYRKPALPIVREQPKKPTVCRRCRWARGNEPGEIINWVKTCPQHYMICMRPTGESVFDPVTGKTTFLGLNQSCKVHNDGNCQHWQPRIWARIWRWLTRRNRAVIYVP